MSGTNRSTLGSALAFWACVWGLSGCATESFRTVQPPTVAAAGTAYAGHRHSLFVGKFDNRSDYLRGLFAGSYDRLGSQAKTILMSHLKDTGRFHLVDRENLEELRREAEIKGEQQRLQGADFAVTGDVAEFGRKEIGDRQLFGILGSGREQVAYSKVALNIVDVDTSEVVYSVKGAGEYALSNRELIGFGGTAGYDSTLNGKVLDLAIREAVNRLVEGLESGAWRPGKPVR